jgi:hypothetical protein
VGDAHRHLDMDHQQVSGSTYSLENRQRHGLRKLRIHPKPVFNYNELPIVFESTSVFRALRYVPCFVALICDGVGRPDVISASACLARVSTVLRAVHFRSCSAKEGLSDLAESLTLSPESPLDHIDVAGNHFKENEVEALLGAYATRVTPLNLLNLWCTRCDTGFWCIRCD